VEPYRLPPDPRPIPTSTKPFVEHAPPRYRDDLPVADLAASFQAAIVDVLAVKTVRAAQRHEAKTVLLAGGVAASLALRERMAAEIAATFGPDGLPFRVPPFSLCTDNAGMIAGAAYYALKSGLQGGWEVDVHPRWPLGSSIEREDGVG
jgi:N6-L-threonylcarbamoyladenine synthase